MLPYRASLLTVKRQADTRRTLSPERPGSQKKPSTQGWAFHPMSGLVSQVVDLRRSVLTQQIKQQRHPSLGAFRGIRRQVIAQGVALVVLVAKIDDQHGRRRSRHFSIIQRDARQIFAHLNSPRRYGGLTRQSVPRRRSTLRPTAASAVSPTRRETAAWPLHQPLHALSARLRP